MGYGANLPLGEFIANDGTPTLETIGQTVEGPNGTKFRFCLNDAGAAGVLGRIPCQKAGARLGNVTFLIANSLISPATSGVTLGVPEGFSMSAPPVNSFFWVQIKGPNAMIVPTSGAIAAGEGVVITGAASPTFIAGPSLLANYSSAAAQVHLASAANAFALGSLNICIPGA